MQRVLVADASHGGRGARRRSLAVAMPGTGLRLPRDSTDGTSRRRPYHAAQMGPVLGAGFRVREQGHGMVPWPGLWQRLCGLWARRSGHVYLRNEILVRVLRGVGEWVVPWFVVWMASLGSLDGVGAFFSFKCGREGHQPATCPMVREIRTHDRRGGWTEIANASCGVSRLCSSWMPGGGLAEEMRGRE